METPSDVPSWAVFVLLGALVLTWAVVTVSIDAHVTPPRSATSQAPFSFEVF